ncbi:threonine/homoserine efflux transporter RhtA [Breoghania corrubedonensis]|uniref:Threonine/homoserine efflux transporter RhtA n=1 Tax=Breoghania corrubedonensis TaxID=665038 RepID=A0A2T5V5U8_9HYPH|nr:DMT family transporter [Breoghania corrubedonensis]PTW59113.1 threonine/homoserine efflux transporter RhtA [Breoghania corrubedonensis]
MSRLTANLILLLTAFIWGSAFVAQSTAMSSVGPLSFTGMRFLIAAACLAPFALREARRYRHAPVSRAHVQMFIVVGLVFFFAISLQQSALVLTSVTNAGFLTGLYVVMVPMLGAIAFHDMPHPIVWPASVASLVGIFLLGGGGLSGLNWGDGLVIVCAVFWAVHVLLVGRVGMASGRPLALSFVQFAVVGVCAFVPGVLLEDLTWTGVKDVSFELLYTAVLSGGLAFTLQVIGQRWTKAADAAIILSSEALFAAICGALFLGERLTPMGLAGCALIFASIVAVQVLPLFGRRRLVPPPGL